MNRKLYFHVFWGRKEINVNKKIKCYFYIELKLKFFNHTNNFFVKKT